MAASVWDATAMLGGSKASLTAPWLAAEAAASPMYRSDMLFELSEAPVLSERLAEPDEPDEVDALFFGEPEG